jgi:hypothetical protein
MDSFKMYICKYWIDQARKIFSEEQIYENLSVHIGEQSWRLLFVWGCWIDLGGSEP